MRKLILSLAFVTVLCCGAWADEAPALSDVPYNHDGTAGELFTYDVDATGDPAPTFVLTEAPSGMTIDAVTGLIEWTPSESQGGLNTVRVEAVNSAGSDWRAFRVRVTNDEFFPPLLEAIPDQTIDAEEWWYYKADAAGYPEPRFSLADYLSRMEIDFSTGQISWKPHWTQAGTHTITVVASSPMGLDTETFELEVLPVMHTVTISSTEGGSVVSPGEGDIEWERGEYMSLEAVPEEGYRFLWWSGGNILDEDSASTTMYVNDNYTVLAVFELIDGPRHTLTVVAGYDGVVAEPGEGTFDYAEGIDVALRAYGENGYAFLNWSGTAVDAGKVANPDLARTTVTVDDDYLIRANFVLRCTLTVESTSGGSVPRPGEHNLLYIPGTVVSLQARADSGYYLSHWSGSAVDKDLVANPYAANTTVLVDRDCRVVANFERGEAEPKPTLTVSSSAGGSVTTPGEGAYEYPTGTRVSIEATGQEGYVFIGWSGTAVDAGRVTNPSATSTVVTVDSDCTLMANFTPATETYSLSLSAGTGGSVSSPGEGTFAFVPNASVLVVASTQAGYEFSKWTGTAVDAGKVADLAASSTTVIVDADYTLQANFSLAAATSTYTLSVSAAPGGSVTGPGEGTFTCVPGETVAVQAVAAEGYGFTGWTGTAVDAGKVADATAASTSVFVDCDYTLVATFAGDLVTLDLSSTTGGSVVIPGEGAITLEPGSDVRAVALPEPGYVFAGWTGTIVEAGALVDSTPARVDFAIEEDASLQANFEPANRCLYVDDDAAGNPVEDGTWDHPFDTIQEAIETAADGDVVLVLTGTYPEHIAFAGKGITVSAFDLSQLGAVSETIIAGVDADSVVTFNGGESSGAILAGFTIMGGDGQFGGGIRCEGADPIIANCLIAGNRAEVGGGVYCQDSRATLVNCTVADNFSQLEGGGLYGAGDIAVTNSIFYGNQPEQIVADPNQVCSVTYSAFRGGWPGEGNINCKPHFAEPGYWSLPGDGVTSVDPSTAGAVWVHGDYHLKSKKGYWNGWVWLCDGRTSSCVDAGNPQVGIKWEPLPNGNRINMGAFGGTAEASQSD